MRRNIVFGTTLLFISAILSAQTPDLKETFLEAESYFLFEEYSEALSLYNRIHRAAPNNNNINYKIGICLLNDPYQKEKSIRYLEQAVSDINPKYKENNFKETSAPTEAYFYLANAYLVNNDIQKALENYKYFLEILDPDVYDVELVQQQINICENARKLMSIPIDYDRVNVGEVINGRFADINPILSGDGKRLVYVSKRQFYDATFFSEKVDGEWQAPRNIIPELGVDGDVYPTSLSFDGNTMIIYRNDEFIGNLYMSTYENGRWTEMEKLGPNINTKYWESHGTLSRDGNTLFFTSNRKGGYGGLDIYRSERLADGSWGYAVNLGPVINTRYNDETPFITENEKILFFSSYGHYNMGGYDVFYSVRDENGNWGEPINLGYPINTTDDELFFFPVNNGYNAYYSQFLEGGYGRHDIYYLDIYSDNNPRMYLVTGSFSTDEGNISEDDNLVIYMVDSRTRDTISMVRPNLVNQTFEIKAPKGDYELLLRSQTFDDLHTRIKISENTSKSGIKIDEALSLKPKPQEPNIFTGSESKIILDDSVYNGVAGEELKIRLRLERNSTLFTDHFVDDSLISSGKFAINSRRYTYVLVPEPGENIVELKMVEENGDISLNRVKVNVPEKQDDNNQVEDLNTGDITPPIQLSQDEMDEERESRYNKMSELSQELLKHAPGKIRELLEGLDVRKEKIETEEDLYNYLKENGVSDSDISEMKLINEVQGKPDLLLKELLKYTDGAAHDSLKTLDLESLNIQTAEQLLQYLKDNNILKEGEESIESVINRALNTEAPVETTLKELQSYAKGDLFEYLDTLDYESEEIYSPIELLDHLASQAGEAFAPELLINVLSDMVQDQPAQNFADFIMKNGPENLKELLRKVDLKKEKIDSVEQLVAYILQHSEELGMDREELQMLLIDLLADFSIEPILEADPYYSKATQRIPLVLTGGLLLAGILFIIIFLWRRKKKEE